MKCIKKSIVLSGMVYTGNNGRELFEWSNGNVIESPVLEPTDDNPSGSYVQIHTLEGILTAIPGSVIMRGVEGEFYPVKESVFPKLYDIIEE